MVEDQSESCLLNMGTTQLGDQDFALKARKPYTITKQREKWTQEDHQKFIEALKLYGRAWRRIQEHVGNKTAVQIRSHAQKFFTKVVRESSGVDGTEVDRIEIPPPRAKRKPTRPYPRKVLTPSKKLGAYHSNSASCSLVSTLENQSQTSVPSECVPKVGSLLDENGSSLSADQDNENSFSMKLGDKTSANSHLPESVTIQSLKLFGKTVFVIDSAMPSSPDTIRTLPWNSMATTREPECFPTTHCWSVDYEDLAYPIVQTSDRDEVTTQDCSHDGENRANSNGIGKGFVAYKRCIEEKNTHTFMLTGEEREDLRVRLCL